MTKVVFSSGQATVDAGYLAEWLGIRAEVVRQKMQDSSITTRFETGQGEDEGRFRLSFFYAGKCYRLTCNAAGDILSRTSFPDINRAGT